MDKRLILAVAGSGKTTYLINQLDLEKRFLLVTYTDNNEQHLRLSIIKKFGYEPNNITVLTYYQFLIRICYRPYLKDEIQAKSIMWKQPPRHTMHFKRDDVRFYLSSDKLLYHNRIAKLCLENCAEKIKDRIERYFDCFMFDEVQDLAGHDFNLIQRILPTTKDCLMVGDFFQHTYETSVDGNVNKSLYKDFEAYIKKWNLRSIKIDFSTLQRSHRCSPTICDFVKKHLGISIESNRTDHTNIFFIRTQEEAEYLYNDNSKVKLFLQDCSKYDCFAFNWGASKGLDDFQDVCIILNKNTLNLFENNSLYSLSPVTKNKLYVACTRAKRDIYFIPHTFIDRFKTAKI
jgi:DNA helicase-2/ATP-dependent DNA helicase PcrA